MIERRVKQPDEATVWTPFAASPGAIVTALAVLTRNLVPTSQSTDVTRPAGGSAAFDAGEFRLGGGIDGETYLVTATAELPGGAVIERELELAVIDGTWAMPDGGVPYLSIAEFVRRFGLPETIAMTDADGSGRIDRDYLVGALQAAQGDVELNVAGRYALPLLVVPEALKTAIGDLARSRLYPRGAPEGVAELAKAATRLLERIASGAAQLPIAAAPAAEPSPTPVLISGRGGRRYGSVDEVFR